MTNLEGKIAVITGAGGGMGNLLVKKLEKEGEELIEIIAKVRQLKTSSQKSLKEEITLTLPLEYKKSKFLEDLISVTKARELKFGNELNIQF